MKKNKIIYWIGTGLISAMMLGSAGMYFFKTADAQSLFVALGYNERIVIPLAILKILGVTAILTNRSKTLKEWAYFGFLIDFLLAFEAHIAIADGEHFPPIVATLLLAISYIYNKKIHP